MLSISSSATPFSFCLQSFPGSGSFPVSYLFPSGGQSIGASASVLPVKIQGWFPLGLTSLILVSKGLLRVFSSITIQKHQFFGTQLSLLSNSHIHTWLLEKVGLTIQTFVSKVMSLLFNTLSNFVIASHRPHWLESKSPLPLFPLVLERSKAWREAMKRNKALSSDSVSPLSLPLHSKCQVSHVTLWQLLPLPS